jgi:hypothetical protein
VGTFDEQLWGTSVSVINPDGNLIEISNYLVE